MLHSVVLVRHALTPYTYKTHYSIRETILQLKHKRIGENVMLVIMFPATPLTLLYSKFLKRHSNNLFVAGKLLLTLKVKILVVVVLCYTPKFGINRYKVITGRVLPMPTLVVYCHEV